MTRVMTSTWLLDLVESLTGVDVAAELVAPLAGPWDGVETYGESLTAISRLLPHVSGKVTAVAESLKGQWEGHAADDPRAYLTSIGASLCSQSVALAKAGEQYQEFATGMRIAQAGAECLLKEVLETAIEIAIWAAAGTATSQTRIGDVLGYGMATYKTVHLRYLIERWTHLVAVAKHEPPPLG